MFIICINSPKMNISKAVLHTVHKSYLQIELLQIADCRSKCGGNIIWSLHQRLLNILHKYNSQTPSRWQSITRTARIFTASFVLFYSKVSIGTADFHPPSLIQQQFRHCFCFPVPLFGGQLQQSVKVLNCTRCVTYLTNELLVMCGNPKNFCLK